MKKTVRVTVPEYNEIAGETVKSHVTVHKARSLGSAIEWAFEEWGGYPPLGAKIIDDDGLTYDVPRYPRS